jgi:hypothetical protein
MPNLRRKKFALFFAQLSCVSAFFVLETQAQQNQQAVTALEEAWPLVDEYCTECHNIVEFRANLSLEDYSPKDLTKDPGIFEEILRKMRIYSMPPKRNSQPSRKERENFVAVLEAALDESAAHKPYAGSTSIHRLNRAEYTNSIRDLLGIDLDLTETLPADSGDYGFDNIGDLLRTSPMLLDRYLTVGMRIADLAMGNTEAAVNAITYNIPFDTSQNKHLAGMPIGTRGGIAKTHYFPADGEYTFSARPLQGVAEGYFGIEGHDRPHDFLIYIDGNLVYSSKIGGKEQHEISVKEFNDVIPVVNQKLTSPKLKVTAGPHEVIWTWRERPNAEQNSWQPVARDTLEIHNTSGNPRLEKVMIEGPYNVSGISQMSTREKILTCDPALASEEENCARQILTNLARRAFRREVNDSDIAAPMAFYQSERDSGGNFYEGIRSGVARTIVSPFFLFRVENDATDTAPGSDQAINAYELASRLSYFLWSSIPDDALLDSASTDSLLDSTERKSQVVRMLNNPKSDSFVENFVGQWLHLRNMDQLSRPDLSMYPDFDDNLRQSMRKETESLFAYVLRENRPVHELLSAEYTFVDERLAKHYGISGVLGSRVRKVDVTDPNRFGLLGHGSISTQTSATSRTSPIMRGKFILSELWNNPPPPAPPNVPALEASAPVGRASTVREQLERHRADPTCAHCHDVIDPVGFAMENFDVDGTWRTVNREGLPIDSSGTLLDGRDIHGPIQLREALLADPELFASTVTEKLLIYALGRGLDPLDKPMVRRIVRGASKENYSLQSIILGIIESYPFLMRTNSSKSNVSSLASNTNLGD